MINKIASKSALQMAAKFTGGNFLVAILGAISTLIYARWIDPYTMGNFNKYTILTGYLGVGMFFISASYNRGFPYYIGKRDVESATHVASVAKWWTSLLVFIGVFLFGTLSIIALFKGDWFGFFGWGVQIVIFGSTVYKNYIKVLYRSNADFLKMNKNNLSSSFAGVLLLPLVYLFGFFGLAGRRIIQDSIEVALFIKNAPYKITAKFDKAELLRFMKFSLPISIPAYLDSALTKSTIAFVILSFIGQKDLGIYTMATSLTAFILIFSSSINQILTTKLMLKYGQTDDFFATFRYIIKPVLILALICFVFVLVAGISLQPLVDFALPKYSESVLIFHILSYELVLSVLRVPFELFISASMKREIIRIRIGKVILTIALLFAFHDSLKMVATIIILANLINICVGYILLFHKLKKLKVAH